MHACLSPVDGKFSCAVNGEKCPDLMDYEILDPTKKEGTLNLFLIVGYLDLIMEETAERYKGCAQSFYQAAAKQRSQTLDGRVHL